jgi:gluconolactonase
VSRGSLAVRLLAALAGWLVCAPAQDFSKIKIEKVSSGFRFTEGPAWSREGYLLFSDVPNRKILKFIAGQPTSVYRGDSNGANGNAFDSQGRLYTCESLTRRVTRTDKRGRIEVLAEKWEGKRLNAPNDIVVRRDGHVYFTDPAFGDQADHRELDFYGVYHISPHGELGLVARSRGRPNGITLSPNGRILYVADTDGRNIRAFDVDRNGEAANERVFISAIEGPPDGIRTDEKGNLYVAAKRLSVYTPEGRPLASIDLPETPSNCQFGDADLQSLYITARTAVYRIRLDVKGALQY